MKYKLESVGEGYFILTDSEFLGIKESVFGIEDYHMSGDYTGPMKFKKQDALKLQRFLNNYCKGKLSIVHLKLYDRIKKHLKLETGLYAE